MYKLNTINASTSLNESIHVAPQKLLQDDIMRKPLEISNMDEMIEAFHELFDGDCEDNQKHYDDPINK